MESLRNKECDKADIYFLDIEFGEVYGMDVAKIITRMNRNAGIVYITNYEEYAIKAFVCRPLGFIRKKHDAEDIKVTMDKIISYMNDVERISRIKHELNKTLIAANLMLKDGRTEEAREFLSQFDGDLDKIIVEKMYTNNIIINEFLTKKSKDCRQKNIDFVAVVNGELKLIKNVDIFCVLSNLLDNAIEAQTFVDNKRVEVFIDENEDVCSLKIYNSISDDMVKAFKEDTLFKTHKKDKLMHGYGLKNVNDVVKKYNGRINYSIIGTCVLCCSVILYREK